MSRTRAEDPAGQLQRVVSVLRWLLLAHAVLMACLRWADVAAAWSMAGLLTVMAAWTLVMTVLGHRSTVPPRAITIADVALAVAVTLISPTVLGAAVDTSGFQGVGYYWVICAALSAALTSGPAIGCLAALLIISSGLVGVLHTGRWAWSPDLLLVVACWALGRTIDQLRAMMAERDRDHATAARLAERERLGRIVHDGVLQVLSMVEREGPDLGPRGQVLARAARGQGGQLRRMLQTPVVEATRNDPGHDLADLVATVAAHESGQVTVSAMAGELLAPARTVEEIDKAVAEVISNVGLHAGDGAHCWILLEEENGTIVVSERDNGTGMAPEQAVGAAAAGRMGITHSITGRIQALGGSTVMRASPGHGVEWEIRVPIGQDGQLPPSGDPGPGSGSS